MKFPLTVCVFLLTVSRSLSVDITVRGTEGEPVSIKCPYPGGYENSYKYFYKGVYRENNIILQSHGKKSSPRFSLKDDHKTRSFTVTIRNLKMEDAGTYGCRAGWGEYKIIKLIVNKAPQKPKPVQISTSTFRPYTNTSTEHTSTEHTSTEQLSLRRHSHKPLAEHLMHIAHLTGNTSGVSKSSCVWLNFGLETNAVMVNPLMEEERHHVYNCDNERFPGSNRRWIFKKSETRTATGNTTVELRQQTAMMRSDLLSVAGGLGSVLLVLTLCSGTFLILKKRKRKSGTALFQQNVQHNTETDRMYEEIPNSDVAAVTSSSNQTPASHLNNRPVVSTVYATVTNQQPDSNPGHTHSTNQVTDSDCDYYANIKSPDPTQDSRTELIYVTATHPQNITTNEGPIYSVITHA
ncbi:uncharacterized protein LOC127508209 isoform X1 [Ctenopharyngodon idella]|uniref:uncharacterized protein LOC127508209 isoform X1 n=1 Tax=Ctenopharyngodon idella TaxID=7959 RepID=UPI00223137E8|nr:uncharacterized protein LOC127508209 isoform X1 [Ctenopharyngodon idella]